jgi:hypothetical protein
MVVVVCGNDAHAVEHWLDSADSHNIYRLARKDASNFGILQQVLYSQKFKPDLVLVCFAGPSNLEYVAPEFNLLDAVRERMQAWWPKNLKNLETHFHQDLDRYTASNGSADSWAKGFYIEPFEILKSYLYITHALESLSHAKIAHLVSLGDFEQYKDQEIQNVQIKFDQFKSVI